MDVIKQVKEYLSKQINETTSSEDINNALADVLDFIEETEAEKRNKEIHAIEKDLENIIDYDEWAGREFGVIKVDLYGTAINLYNAGYRKINT